MRREAPAALGAVTRRIHLAAARLWPDGGQGQARRNAWAAMVNDHIHARARADAERAIAAATAALLVGAATAEAAAARP